MNPNPCDILEKKYKLEQEFMFNRMMSADIVPKNMIVMNETNFCLSEKDMDKKIEKMKNDFEPLYKSADTCVGFDCVQDNMLCKIWEPAYSVMGEEVKGHSKAPMLWNITTKNT
jgi:hypothetical protein